MTRTSATVMVATCAAVFMDLAAVKKTAKNNTSPANWMSMSSSRATIRTGNAAAETSRTTASPVTT